MPDIVTSVIVMLTNRKRRASHDVIAAPVGSVERWQGTVVGGTKVPRRSCLVKRHSLYLATPADGMPSDGCNTLHSRSFHGLK
jgi:hypothetical protein